MAVFYVRDKMAHKIGRFKTKKDHDDYMRGLSDGRNNKNVARLILAPFISESILSNKYMQGFSVGAKEREKRKI